jgi:ApbE superfamily uncharacterized protein (UPF0280 family)
VKSQEFKYRKLINAKGLVRSAVIDKESDILVFAEKALTTVAHETLKKEKKILTEYTAKNQHFESSLTPIRVSPFAPHIVRLMAWAGKRANVGPMSSVAGAMAEQIGKELLKHSKEAIVENGGDIFIKTTRTRKIGIFAGKSPFSENIALEITPEETPLGICTSAGFVGHIISTGAADAIVVVARSCALADAAVNSISALVKSEETIGDGLEMAKKIKGLHGVLIIKNDKIGAWGTLKIVSI